MEKILEKLNNTDKESTAYPYWIIIDPRQNFRCDIHEIAGMITGIFFSRKDAQNFLDNKSYRFSKNAKVYCHSGHESADWRSLFFSK